MDFDQLQLYFNHGLAWIGFGAIIGLVTIALMHGRDQSDSVATILMAIVGALLGCALLKYFYWEEAMLPGSPKGFLVGTAGALVILVSYKVLGGNAVLRAGTASSRQRRRRRRHSGQYSLDD